MIGVSGSERASESKWIERAFERRREDTILEGNANVTDNSRGMLSMQPLHGQLTFWSTFIYETTKAFASVSVVTCQFYLQTTTDVSRDCRQDADSAAHRTYACFRTTFNFTKLKGLDP